MVTVTIPTYLSKENKNINSLIQSIKKYWSGECIASCIYQSAAANRNWCIDNANNDIIIMLDDDCLIRTPNFVEDLIKPLIDSPDKYSIVSARLVDLAGKKSAQLGGDTWLQTPYQTAVHWSGQLVTSACIAFNRKDGIRFNEDFKSAVCEDSYFCWEYRQKFPKKDIIINNLCQIVHLNEMKRMNQADVCRNFELFNKLTGIKLI